MDQCVVMKTINEIQSILRKIKTTSNRGVKWEKRVSTETTWIAKDYSIADLVRDLERIASGN